MPRPRASVPFATILPYATHPEASRSHIQRAGRLSMRWVDRRYWLRRTRRCPTSPEGGGGEPQPRTSEGEHVGSQPEREEMVELQMRESSVVVVQMWW